MIVVCPSCNRRYRHEMERPAAASVAHCSECDERFPLAPPKRTYVLADAGTAPEPALPPFPVDRDLPPIADAPGPTADDLTIPLEATPASPAEVEFPRVGGTDPEPAPAADAVPTESAAPGSPRPSAGRRALVESLVALVPCGIGAGLAYHLAGPAGQDPVTWAALGGAVGLLVGWACLLWITRED